MQSSVSGSWRIQESALGGRGIFANRDIKTGEIILIDDPLIIGPKTGIEVLLHCVICSKLSDLDVCSNGCGLPVCSENCEKSPMHQKECELIRKLSIEDDIDEISMELFSGLTLLRAFLLDENHQQMLSNLVGHIGPRHGFEVELVKKKIKLKDNDEKFMKKICCILDCNSFETKVIVSGTEVTLRALYPLSCLVNHSCIPNAAYLFDENQKMILKASQPIPKDSEIFIIYVNPLWGTTSRRLKLATSKHFWCECNRCKDSKEFDTYLNGLKCRSAQCQGLILPINPLDNFSDWRCEECRNLVARKNIGTVQNIVEGYLHKLNSLNVDELIDFIENQLPNFVPAKNQIAIELKIQVMQMLGHTKKYSWKALTNNQLIYKEELCKELLQVMMDLRLGQWKLRGLILYELYRCQLEKCSRTKSTVNLKQIKEVQQQYKKLLIEAAEILKNDITAPKEIKNFNASQNVANI